MRNAGGISRLTPSSRQKDATVAAAAAAVAPCLVSLTQPRPGPLCLSILPSPTAPARSPPILRWGDLALIRLSSRKVFKKSYPVLLNTPYGSPHLHTLFSFASYNCWDFTLPPMNSCLLSPSNRYHHPMAATSSSRPTLLTTLSAAATQQTFTWTNWASVVCILIIHVYEGNCARARRAISPRERSLPNAGWLYKETCS